MCSQLCIACPIIVLTGPTAIGKTSLSFTLVKEFDCEILSMDSMQVYRFMDIGTAKPTAQELTSTPHHLINIVDPDEKYDAARFVKDALQAIETIAANKHTVLLTGGTGFYLKALVNGLFSAMPTDHEIRKQLKKELELKGKRSLHKKLQVIDPQSAARIHENDSQRVLRGLEIYLSSGKSWSQHLKQQKESGQTVKFTNMHQVALNCDREVLYQRIEQRTQIMLDQGLVEEVEMLLAKGYPASLSSMQAIGYRHANAFVAGQWDWQTMKDQLIRDTRRYAKRQLTWFSNNKDMQWFDRSEKKRIIEYLKRRVLINNSVK
jgi:tRNA dimethylallyltransferase